MTLKSRNGLANVTKYIRLTVRKSSTTLRFFRKFVIGSACQPWNSKTPSRL